MRITQSMLTQNFLRNYNNNLTRINKLEEQMSTGKKINKPSDDPVGLSFSLRYRSSLEANEQYQRNVDSATSWLDYTDSMISEANDVLQRTRELAVQGANGTNSEASMNALGQEVEQLYDQLVNVGNTRFNGKYIFNGQKTDVKPYDPTTAGTDVTDSGKIQLEISSGISIPVNISGSELFGDAGDPTNAFQVLDNLKNALFANDSNSVGNILGDLDNRLDHVMEKWSEIGARSNRVDLISNRLEEENVNVQSLLSKTEDADMAEVMTNLTTEESIYQASLSTGAKIIQPSLVDFLR